MEPIRTQMTARIHAKLASVATDADASVVARRLERACHNTACTYCMQMAIIPSYSSDQFIDAYSAYTYHILDLLSCPATSAELCGRLFSNTIHIPDIPTMPPAQICPHTVLVRESELVSMRREQKIDVKTSTLYRCEKCGQRNTTIVEVQTRAADEPPTLYIHCANELCRHSWKFNA